jgi:nucleoid-associated protein YgaU
LNTIIIQALLGNVKQEELIIPVNPEKVSVKTGKQFQEYNIMEVGKVNFPYGDELDEISFDSFFPGPGRVNSAYVTNYIDAKTLDKQMKTWKESGQKLRLQITETELNLDVWIKIYDKTFENVGDIGYSLAFIQARDLILTTTTNETKNNDLKPRVENKQSGYYTVVPGDTLWGIAKRKLGDGSRYMEIYDLNKTSAGGKLTSPNTLTSGTILKMPK